MRAAVVTPEVVSSWLRRWSDLQKVVWEARSALKRPRAADVRDDAAQQAFQQFTGEIMAPFHKANAALTTRARRRKVGLIETISSEIDSP